MKRKRSKNKYSHRYVVGKDADVSLMNARSMSLFRCRFLTRRDNFLVAKLPGGGVLLTADRQPQLPQKKIMNFALGFATGHKLRHWYTCK